MALFTRLTPQARVAHTATRGQNTAADNCCPGPYGDTAHRGSSETFLWIHLLNRSRACCAHSFITKQNRLRVPSWRPPAAGTTAVAECRTDSTVNCGGGSRTHTIPLSPVVAESSPGEHHGLQIPYNPPREVARVKHASRARPWGFLRSPGIREGS